MSELNLYRTELVAENGEKVRLVYDEGGDILEIFFGENEPATGVDMWIHTTSPLLPHSQLT